MDKGRYIDSFHYCILFRIISFCFGNNRDIKFHGQVLQSNIADHIRSYVIYYKREKYQISHNRFEKN